MVSRTLVSACLTVVLIATTAVAQTVGHGPDLVEETYRDWIVRCETPQTADGTPGARICEMAQELSQADTGQRVLRMALQATEAGAAWSLVTPFGLRLSDGVALEVATERVAEIGFRTCLPQGCIASAVLDDPTLAIMAAGEAVEVIMTADAGQTVSLRVSLSGFSGAWSRLAELHEQ